MSERDYLKRDIEDVLDQVLPHLVRTTVKEILADARLAEEGKVYDISKEVVTREEPAHMRRCENATDGPICKVRKEMHETNAAVELELKAIGKTLSEDRGARKRTAWVLAVLVAVFAGAQVGFQLVRGDSQAAVLQQLKAISAEMHKK